jgi:hypothetical protein
MERPGLSCAVPIDHIDEDGFDVGVSAPLGTGANISQD